MKITLVQSEIELALREYVGRQLKVADGMSMSIELAATRAAGVGYTAIIDIIPATGEKVVTLAPKTLAALGAAAFQSVGSSNNTGLTSNKTEEQSTEGTTSNENNEVNSEQTPLVEASTDDSGKLVVGPGEGLPTSEVTSEIPAPSPSRSLFGGLKKPKNN